MGAAWPSGFFSCSSGPEELFEDDLNGLDDESDELPKLACVVRLLEQPVASKSAALMINLDAIRMSMARLLRMVCFLSEDQPPFG